MRQVRLEFVQVSAWYLGGLCQAQGSLYHAAASAAYESVNRYTKVKRPLFGRSGRQSTVAL
jgi:hypothetical protein